MPSASAWVEWDLQSIEQRSAHAQKRSASSFGAAEFSRYIVELEAASSCNLRLLDYTRFILVIYLTNASFWWYKGGRYILEEAKNSCNHIDSSRNSLINGIVKSQRDSERKYGRIHITKSVVDFTQIRKEFLLLVCFGYRAFLIAASLSLVMNLQFPSTIF